MPLTGFPLLLVQWLLLLLPGLVAVGMAGPLLCHPLLLAARLVGLLLLLGLLLPPGLVVASDRLPACLLLLVP